MLTHALLATAIAAQLVAAYFATRLTRVRGATVAWAYLAGLVILVGGARMVGWFGADIPQNSLLNEERVVAGLVVAVSALLLVAVLLVRRHHLRAQSHELLYRTLFDGATDAVFVLDPTGRVLEANARAGEILAWEPRRLCGMSFEEVTAAPLRPRAAEQVRGVFAQREAHFQWTCLTREGRDVPVAVSCRVVEVEGRRMLHAVARDLTREKRAEEELRRSEERYRTLVENAAIGLYRTTPDGRVLMANRTLVRMLGYETFVELAARNLDADLRAPPGLQADVRQRIQRDGEALGVETSWRRRDGTPIDVRESVRAVRADDGTIAGLEGTVEDVGERRQVEAQLRWAQKMEAVGRLAAGIAHDFNNTLTAIMGFAELVELRLPPGDPVHKDLDGILAASGRAASLVRQLLAVGRKQVLRPRVLDLNAAIEGARGMVQRVAGEAIEIRTRAAPGLGRVRADPGQIEQVLLNLALNARDAMPDGGEITIETADVELDEASAAGAFRVRPGRYVMVSVRDTGAGMDEATRQRVFEPFFTTKEQGKGTGLGLASVYGIVKQSDGYIFVDSRVGEGTTFRIYLPRVEAPADEESTSGGMGGFPRGTETVLVAEDEEVVRDLLVETLETAGYRVLSASDGHEALALAARYLDPIHLLVSDVVMPRVAGPELARRLSSRRTTMKVLFVSGHSEEAVTRQGRLRPGAAWLQKPFTPEVFARKVRQTLDRPSALASSTEMLADPA